MEKKKAEAAPGGPSTAVGGFSAFSRNARAGIAPGGFEPPLPGCFEAFCLFRDPLSAFAERGAFSLPRKERRFLVRPIRRRNDEWTTRPLGRAGAHLERTKGFLKAQRPWPLDEGAALLN